MKINIIHIVLDHLKTLRNIRSGKISITDIVVFFIVPLIISYLLVWCQIFSDIITGDLIKAIAIFSAFLFNMLAIVNGALKSDDVDRNRIKKIYAQEIHSNLSFVIIVGIILTLTLISQSMIAGNLTNYKETYYYQIIQGVNYFFIGVFVLTLLMCLNRVYILLKN